MCSKDLCLKKSKIIQLVEMWVHTEEAAGATAQVTPAGPAMFSAMAGRDPEWKSTEHLLKW